MTGHPAARAAVRLLLLPAVAVTAALLTLLAFGGSAARAEEPEHCPRLMALDGPRLVPAAWTAAETGAEAVALTFLGHATFLIESPDGVTIVTDYNDGIRPPVVPTIATMNRAHPTHFSLSPDPRIAHLLRGWGEDGAPAHHDLTVGDVWVRNVTTNIRDFGGVIRDANSIFVFEVAGLCIAHLSHLHHKLTEDHLKALGRIDVVLVPVDGSYTLNVEEMIETLNDIQAPLVIPMHIFSMPTLAGFLGRMERDYRIERAASATVRLSRQTLPPMRTVMVLPGF